MSKVPLCFLKKRKFQSVLLFAKLLEMAKSIKTENGLEFSVDLEHSKIYYQQETAEYVVVHHDSRATFKDGLAALSYALERT